MARDVTIKIRAEDSASPTFKTIGQNAKQMGTDVEQSAQRSSRSYEDLGRHATTVGAALGTVAAGMSIAGQAAANQERQVDGLRRVYGESSEQIIAFSKALQDSTNF